MHQSLNKHLANGMFTRAHRTRRMWMWMWINGWNLYIQMNTNEFYNILKMTHIPCNTLLMLMLMLMIGGIFRSVDSGRRKKAIIQPQKWTHLLTLNFVMAISEIVLVFWSGGGLDTPSWFICILFTVNTQKYAIYAHINAQKASIYRGILCTQIEFDILTQRKEN